MKALVSGRDQYPAGGGLPTVRDILDALARPGRDPREDLPPPIFKKGILKLEDLQPGMELKGTVLNVVDFGAFVDIGLKDSGLVHISQMANRYVKSPYDVVAVGDVVTVWVLTVDQERRRVSLTMIKPGTERKPPEKKPRPAASAAGQPRPPRQQGGAKAKRRRGRRPGGRPPRRTPSQDRRPSSQWPRQGGGRRQPPAAGHGRMRRGVGRMAVADAERPPQPANGPGPREPSRPVPKPKLPQDSPQGVGSACAPFGGARGLLQGRRDAEQHGRDARRRPATITAGRALGRGRRCRRTPR